MAVGAEVGVIGVAGISELREVLVDFAVAVIVDIVAQLLDVLVGFVDAFDARFICGAGVGAVLTQIRIVAVAGQSLGGEIFIDFAVAVVVHAVTNFNDVGRVIANAEVR